MYYGIIYKTPEGAIDKLVMNIAIQDVENGKKIYKLIAHHIIEEKTFSDYDSAENWTAMEYVNHCII